MSIPEPPRPGPRRPPRPGSPPPSGAGRAPSPPPGGRTGPSRPPRPPRPAGARPAPDGRTTAAPVGSPASRRTVEGLIEASKANKAARQREVQRNRLVVGAGMLFGIVLLLAFCSRGGGGGGGDTKTTASGGGSKQSSGSGDGSTSSASSASVKAGSGLAKPSDYDGWVDPKSSGEPWSTKVVGQLTFRGNPTRSYYGLGPVPKDPKVQWSYPESGGMCSNSPVGGQNKTWCGSGWTGEPALWQQDGKTWLAVGTYDQHIHFLNPANGQNRLEPYDMGDIIKGSVTKDPDGFPLLYSGSRADFHILALDRKDGQAHSLWTLRANDVSPTKWNDDWDGSPLVIDDYLFEGGENGQFHIVKLNRRMGTDGLVQVDPKIVFHTPGWDAELTKDLQGSGARVNDVSIENSVSISGNTVYFSNSGGLVQGWDIKGLKDGITPERVFRFWSGDDTDASVVIDKQGYLYIGQEVERSSSASRNQEVGQLVKLDPRKPDDPIVWSVSDPNGIWATPAIYDGVVVAPTDSGRIIGADQKTGKVLWEKKLPGPTWSSPVIVDKVWIQGDCAGNVRAFDFSKPRKEPKELWSVKLEGCVESTPALFKGQIFVGARGGKFYAIGDD